MLEMKRVVQLSIICWLAAIVSTFYTGFDRKEIVLSEDGGYTDILIAISEEVPENLDIINKLQKYFTKASPILLHATKNRLFFKHITILVPKTWTRNTSWSTPTAGENYYSARVLVDLPSKKWNNVPYTRQPFACGEEGWFIHFTPEYLTRDTTDDVTYKPAKKIVKEFAQLKWGLFDEVISNWKDAVGTDTQYGCTGKFYTERLDVDTGATCTINIITGVYAPSCQPVIKSTDGNASLLAFEYLEKIQDFCSNENDVNFKHNTDTMNLQNGNCNEQSAWEVMNNHADFGKDYSTTRASETSTVPVFAIKQSQGDDSISNGNEAVCEQDIVCLCLDVSGSMRRSHRINIMSQSVKTYIMTHLRNGTAVGIVSFSTETIVNAPMTVINNVDDRLELVTKVPTVADGGTGIGGGLRACQTILRDYTGDNIDKTRIILLSDGEETNLPKVEDVLPSIKEDGILIDTILYDQGAVLYETSSFTGGNRHLASDSTSSQSLDLFLALMAAEGCDVDHTAAVIESTTVIIPAREDSHNGSVYLDVTVGLQTKLVFKYDAEINVTVNSSSVVINEFPSIDLITAEISDITVGEVAYTIYKLGDITAKATIIFTATSTPVSGEEAIVFTDWTNDANVKFDGNSTVVPYVAASQGMSPVGGLTIKLLLEQPNGDIVVVKYVDDGTGKDSIAYDGIYTGFLPAHRLYGAGGIYYSLIIKITGEGSLYGAEDNNRKKRCSDCDDLGYIARTIIGGVLVINNWYQVNDTTPPDRITDLRVLNAAAGDRIFTLGWTAPGDDLNIGTVTGYEFTVGVNSSKEYMVSLTENALLSNVSGLLVEARKSLQIQINASEITPEMFGLNQSTEIHTYYFRMRTYDAKNNFADWSNPAPASYFDPSMFTSSSAAKTSEQPRAAQIEVIEQSDALVLALSATAAVIVTVALTGLAIFCYIKSKRQKLTIHRRQLNNELDHSIL